MSNKQAGSASLELLWQRISLWRSPVLVAAVVALLVVPAGGALRLPGVDDTLGSLRPFLTGIVVLVAMFFAVAGIVYGALTGSIRNDRDVIDAMAKSMATLSLYIVLVFFAAQFVAFFGWILLLSGAVVLVHLALPAVIRPLVGVVRRDVGKVGVQVDDVEIVLGIVIAGRVLANVE